MFAFTEEPQTPGALTGVDAIGEARLSLAPWPRAGGPPVSSVSEADNIWLNFSDRSLAPASPQSEPPAPIPRRGARQEDKGNIIDWTVSCLLGRQGGGGGQPHSLTGFKIIRRGRGPHGNPGRSRTAGLQEVSELRGHRRGAHGVRRALGGEAESGFAAGGGAAVRPHPEGFGSDAARGPSGTPSTSAQGGGGRAGAAALAGGGRATSRSSPRGSRPSQAQVFGLLCVLGAWGLEGLRML